MFHQEDYTLIYKGQEIANKLARYCHQAGSGTAVEVMPLFKFEPELKEFTKLVAQHRFNDEESMAMTADVNATIGRMNNKPVALATITADFLRKFKGMTNPEVVFSHFFTVIPSIHEAMQQCITEGLEHAVLEIPRP